MTKFTKTTLFKPYKSKSETLMDKTTRVVREILDEETTKSDVKTARLRKARLEREASAAANPITETPKTTRKKPRSKTAGKI